MPDYQYEIGRKVFLRTAASQTLAKKGFLGASALWETARPGLNIRSLFRITFRNASRCRSGCSKADVDDPPLSEPVRLRPPKLDYLSRRRKPPARPPQIIIEVSAERPGAQDHEYNTGTDIYGS
jgi:hypothetical protein